MKGVVDMYAIRVYFNDSSVLECMEVRNSKAFWRKVSKTCNYFGSRVVKVEKKVIS